MHKKMIAILAVLLALSLCACELPVSLPIENPLREVDTTPISFGDFKEPAQISEVKSTLTEKQYAVAPGTVDESPVYDETNVELFGLYETQKEIEVVKQAEAKKKQEKKGSSGSGNSSGNGNSSQGSGSSQGDSNFDDYYYGGGYTYTAPSVDGFAEQVVALVNAERVNAGLGSVSATSALNQAAQKRAEEIVSTFSHSRPDGRTCFTVFDEYGIAYGYAGENIAAGQSSPGSVMNSWMNSSGHKANILGANFNHIGVGVVYIEGSGYGYYWVQLFTD